MAKSPRFASSRFAIINPEASVTSAQAVRGLPRFHFQSTWSDSKAGGNSLTHP
jgi:hypothetical protein